MPDEFQYRTKNNGLKNVVWGSEEFKKAVARSIQHEKEEYIHSLIEDGATEREIMEAMQEEGY